LPADATRLARRAVPPALAAAPSAYAELMRLRRTHLPSRRCRRYDGFTIFPPFFFSERRAFDVLLSLFQHSQR